MISAINSALSGLFAAGKRIETAAMNIANQSSTQSRVDGQVVNQPYVPQQVDQVSLSSGGVEALVRNAGQPTVTVYNPSDAAANTDGTVQMPNVDVAEQLVNTQIASNDFKANLKTLQVQDNMTQSLLDIIS